MVTVSTSFFFHWYETPLLFDKVTELPSQNVVTQLAVIVALGKVFTVTTVALEVEEQPFPSVTTTL